MNNQIEGVKFFFWGGGGGGSGRKGDRVDCIQLHFFTSLHFHFGN